MKWFYDMAKGYKDVHMVGEDWTDVTSDIYEMYETGIDSLFNFKFANNGGEIPQGRQRGREFAKKLRSMTTISRSITRTRSTRTSCRTTI